MSKALIIGSEGQDGTLLKHLLRSKGYSVYGLGRSAAYASEELDGYIQMDIAGDDKLFLED